MQTRRNSTARFRLTFTLLAALLCPIAHAQQKPNIIFLLADDQRLDTLAAYGNTVIQTPHIDSLAKQGVTFNNAFVTTSICMTNRASIFLGQYAARHGIIDFSTPLGERINQTYLMQLKQAGYRVGYIGKWGVGQPPRNTWDYDKAWAGQNRFWHEIDGQRKHLTAIHGDQAVEFIEGSTADQPFALAVSFKAPHVQDTYSVTEDPFPEDDAFQHLYNDVTFPRPPSEALFDTWPDFLKNSENRARWAVRFWGPDRYQDSVAGYYRLITGIDHAVGRILDSLEQQGLTDNTVIIYSSDHGFYLGEYGYAGKWFGHDISIRVPLIIHDPRLPASQKGTRRNEIALSIDLAPTMLSLAGIQPPDTMQGRDLTPVLQNQTPVDWRTTFFYEHNFVHPRIPRNEGVRTPRYKYLRYIDSQPLFEELYDLEADPAETVNLATHPAHQQTLQTMRTQWATLREQAK